MNEAKARFGKSQAAFDRIRIPFFNQMIDIEAAK